MKKYLLFVPAILVYLLSGPTVADDACVPSEEEKADGFVSLFNGKNLDGWEGSTDGYAVQDGNIVCIRGKGGFLFTNKEYANFVLRFEFKLEPGGNNGLAVRAPLEGNPAYSGMELQILDNESDKYRDKLADYQYHGSIYGVVPAKRGFLKPAGEWNSQEVVADGSKIKVVLNGEVIVDTDLADKKPIDGQPHPGLHRKTGHLGFCGHGDQVEFRNLRVKELK